jgi:hypothetical protein
MALDCARRPPRRAGRSGAEIVDDIGHPIVCDLAHNLIRRRIQRRRDCIQAPRVQNQLNFAHAVLPTRHSQIATKYLTESLTHCARRLGNF